MSKFELKIGEGAQVGDVTVGENIKVNKTVGAGSSDDIKALLEQLAEQVAKLADKLPEEEAAEATDDLEWFTREVTKDNPKRKRWSVIAERIQGAAESVGTAGATAISVLDKLKGLLG